MRNLIFNLENLINKYQGIGYGTSSIKKELNSFKKYIQDGKIFVDVGGNKGIYTEGIFSNYKPSQVHIFEPANTNILN